MSVYSVGLLVGSLVGSLLGSLLGIELKLGLLEGSLLGPLLGIKLLLGSLDGPLLGIKLKLGCPDGSLLGSMLGSVLGIELRLGSLDGPLLGSLDGSLVHLFSSSKPQYFLAPLRYEIHLLGFPVSVSGQQALAKPGQPGSGLHPPPGFQPPVVTVQHFNEGRVEGAALGA